MPEDPNPSASKEREFETGEDEFFKFKSELNAVNAKRTYDAYQHAELSHVHNSQALFQQASANLQQQLSAINNLTTQHLQNSIQIAHQLNQQAARHTEESFSQYKRHSDLAADSYWNPVSAGAGMNLTAGSIPANRNIDETTAVAGGAVANASATVASAVAKQMDATVAPVVGILQQLVAQIAAMNASMANVIAQVQPKTAA